MKNSKGFTLIETLVAFFILAISFLAILGVYNVSYTLWVKGRSTIETNENVSLALEQMARELRTAQLIYAPSRLPATLSSVSFLVYDSSNNLKLITYGFNSVKGEVYRMVNNSASQKVPITNKVYDFLVTYKSENLYKSSYFQVYGMKSVTLTIKAYSGSNLKSYSIEVSPRIRR